MKNKLLIILGTLVLYISVYANDSQLSNDGPYIFIEKDYLIETNIINGKVIKKNLPLDVYETVYPIEKVNFENIENVAVLSDIHGQYDLTVTLFKNNKIIDEDLNWSFGQGHLVIVGDIFDRGPQVNEVLWLIYKLEKQAKATKGRVHFLLGNHEYMVLRKDLRYIHGKYQKSVSLLETDYAELYGKNTILGRWLRSKATIMKIDQHTFVHGGISKEFASPTYDMENANNVMRESIDMDRKVLESSGFYQKYYGTNGPIWYRGLILGDLDDKEMTSILKTIQSDHLVVGHCSDDQIVQLHDQRVFGVDSSIKNGQSGEILFIKDGREYYRGTLEGKKIRLIN